MDSQSDTELREYIPDRRACQKTLAEVQSVPSACLRTSCLSFEDSLMHPVDINLLHRDILAFGIKPREQHGRAEHFMPGILTCS
jgi:hypothetical protein